MGSEHPFPHKSLNFQWNIYRLKITNDFVCNSLWEPVFEFTFSEVRHIRPAVHVHPDHISPGTIADTWLRILYHLRNVFMSPSLLQPTPPENHTVWVHCICSPSLEIPMSERAVIMWIWLLWSSTKTPIPFFLVSKLRSAPVPSLDVPKASDALTLKHRLSVLTSLHSEGLITSAEFKTKRQCIISSLWTYRYLLKWTALYISLKTDERLLAA